MCEVVCIHRLVLLHSFITPFTTQNGELALNSPVAWRSLLKFNVTSVIRLIDPERLVTRVDFKGAQIT